MKYILSIILITGSILSKAQKLEPTEKLALLIVTVVNDKEKPLEGETVSFVAAKDKKVYSGITKADGKFEILVPKADKYNVQYKTFSVNKDYNVLDMPSEEGLI